MNRLNLRAAVRHSTWHAAARRPLQSQCHNVAIPVRYHSSDASKTVPLAPSGITALPDRSLIRVAGQDALRFLQGLTTNNVDAKRQSGWYTAFLNATGRVQIDAIVWPLLHDITADSWACLLDVDRREAKALRSYMMRHKLRSKLEIRELEGLQVWTAWSENPASTKGDAVDGYYAPTLEGNGLSSYAMMTDPRIPGFATRFITTIDGNISNSGISSAFVDLPAATTEQFKLHRYLNGVAEGPHEIYANHYQAHPSNLDILNAIDFRKGCYVGQELTIRTEHTGVVRKRILPVQAYNGTESPPDSLTYDNTVCDTSNVPFETKVTATGVKREAGKWIAGIGNIGLAMCRLESMTDLKVSAEGGLYTAETTFSLASDTGAGLNIKAFVPDWMRKRIKQPKTARG